MTNHRYDICYICSMKKKVVICGSRGFSDMALLRKKMCAFLSQWGDVVIISGAARGADALGELFADEMGFDVIRFPAEWSKYGRAAGVLRNDVMCSVADAVVCFWDGVSRGSADMIRRAADKGVPVRVVRF